MTLQACPHQLFDSEITDGNTRARRTRDIRDLLPGEDARVEHGIVCRVRGIVGGFIKLGRIVGVAYPNANRGSLG